MYQENEPTLEVFVFKIFMLKDLVVNGSIPPQEKVME